ncbi:hypothetical protein A2572_00045 [Candidatus Collierbacteria bacterium RIFOXYD1_FULL_40_9]|uniref:Uncharacterized protein n=1 Tax=Candidatus Collierbacteria bacterium RIFOXYD1_FULL_40_9 TaxID=1817731 RepID=A0A1F5FWE9_9BACT|nr:MAG: hypothetical protein A2572_00045 [Candidatus Collierbacteria bacterium RIFOXYD1_FULL_40_9]
MPKLKTDIYSYVADIILLPMIQGIVDDAGGFITDTGLIWPVEEQNGHLVYYDINVISKEIYLLPNLDSDQDEAIEVTDKRHVLKLQNHIEDFIYVVTHIGRILRNKKSSDNFYLGQGPKDIPFFIATSLS